MFSKRIIFMVAAGLMAMAIVAVIYASTASNTVPNSKAGEGEGTITGYDVSSVHYELNGSDPSKIDSVTFTLDSVPPAGSTVKVKLQASAATWYSCSADAASVVCATNSPQATVVAADQLTVVVAQ